MSKKFHSFEPKDHEVSYNHRFMLGGIAPRPIAFVSTQSVDGVDNLAPYSFFNAFGANPPYIAFSPARRGRDNTTKDTYHNLLETKECVVHIVEFDIVEQMNLASCEYPSETDEFIKAGFNKLDSDLIKPKRVLESPFHMECRLDKMIELGGKAGSGNLALCEVVKFHVDEEKLTDGMLNPELLDSVGRNGGNYYTRASGKALFEIAKPNRNNGVGFDNLPNSILKSDILSGNDLGKLAMVNEIPSKEKAIDNYQLSYGDVKVLHQVVKDLLSEDRVDEAWYEIVAYENGL
ncbi:MAG: flavin reductase family protein [Candidatus Kapaibacteriales bacterium]